MADDLSWTRVEHSLLTIAMDHVSAQEGTITFMFGGYGHYLNCTWKIGGVAGKASGRTAEEFERRLRERLLGEFGS